MNDFNLIVSSLVLAALLPISVAALYALMARHIQLSPDAAMDTVVAYRFGTEAERHEYHAAYEDHQQLRAAAVLTRYRQTMERELATWDPRRAAPFRQALAATATHPALSAPPGPGCDQASEPGSQSHETSVASLHPTPRHQPRPTLWRAHLAARRQ